MEPNEVIGDRYELGEPIGRGGMATILKATDLRMGRLVAVKVLREVYSSDPKFVTRFQREARAASALQHPNIVQVFDYGQSGNSYYIVMEFVDGADLRRYLKRQGILSNERAVEIAHDVALGLGAAHRRGIVHRDVKPQNILLNDDGLVKLTDFGIASMYTDAEAERLTTTGMTLGTVQYYAPEQAQGEIVSPAADIYALGIVMYEMLTGHTPFDGDTPVAIAMHHIQDPPEPPSHFNPNITPSLERIILRCLEKDPHKRYRDGDALAYALENFNTRAPAPAGRRYGTSAPPQGGRSQFISPPLGSASGIANNPNNPWQPPAQSGRPVGPAGRASQFGSSAVASGPRGGAAGPGLPPGFGGPSRPGLGNGAVGMGGMGGDPIGYDAPTFEDYDGPLAVGTHPYGQAAGTEPRITGPNGTPDGGRRNGPLVATIVVSTVLILLVSCSLILAATGAFGALGSLFASATPTPAVVVQKTTVPNFIGKQFTDAQALAQQSHLQVTEQDKADEAAPGTVLDQDVAANKQVPYDTNITLTVSSGPDSVEVPNVVGQGLTDACKALAKDPYDLVCRTAQNGNNGYEYSETIPANAVTRTEPAAGTSVKPGSTVTVYLSSGPQPTPTTAAPTATPTPADQPTATPTVTPTPGS